MPSAAKTKIPGEAVSREQEYETVREVYEALYRGVLDEKRAADLLLDLNRRNRSWAARAFGDLTRRH